MALKLLVTMKGVKVLLAIDQDPEPSIFGLLDHGVVGGLGSVLPELADRTGGSAAR